MSRKRSPRPPAVPVAATIDSLSHDGRGVAHIDGKAVFVDGALAGESVSFVYVARRRHFDEARAVEIHTPSPLRVAPRCAHFGVCGGCVLQHLAPDAQIEAKQEILLENLRRIGQVQPRAVLQPLTGPHWQYRYQARLGVKYVPKKARVLVGFRERHMPYLADLSRCEVLLDAVGARLPQLAEVIGGLSVRSRIPQVEVAAGDDAVALVFRNLDPLMSEDEAKLREFGAGTGMHIYLQPAGPESVHLLWPAESRLVYRLPAHGIEMEFRPTDFVQINPAINRALVDRVLEFMAVGPNERVLDLFCGLGNFTLPLARIAGHVVGVEGEEKLVQRARDNARHNGIDNVEFHAADLEAPDAAVGWSGGRYDKVLLDPPRSGARGILAQLPRMATRRIVYVSCHPGTLARDAGVLVNELGFTLTHAGVLDMFPHTAHVESIAVFDR